MPGNWEYRSKTKNRDSTKFGLHLIAFQKPGNSRIIAIFSRDIKTKWPMIAEHIETCYQKNKIYCGDELVFSMTTSYTNKDPFYDEKGCRQLGATQEDLEQMYQKATNPISYWQTLFSHAREALRNEHFEAEDDIWLMTENTLVRPCDGNMDYNGFNVVTLCWNLAGSNVQNLEFMIKTVGKQYCIDAFLFQVSSSAHLGKNELF